MSTELWEKYGMLPRGSRVLCAVSGGADSMCLLHMLRSKSEELGIEVAAAHYEHGLRGEESLRDARFVEKFCRDNNILCVVSHGNVAQYAEKNGLGTEEAARLLRYEFLERTADELGCGRIATAHNADDNAETVIFNLCRGAGLAGLCGIPPVRGRIVRPLLDMTRAEIERYLDSNGVPHVEDSTNALDDYSRNIIRHRVTPVMRELNPRFAEAALRTAELMRQDGDFIDGAARGFIEKNFDGESVGTRPLSALHPALAGRVVRMLCPKSLSQAHVEAALALTRGSGLAFLDLPGIRLRREQGRIYFGADEHIEIRERELIPGETLHIPEAGLLIRSEMVEKTEEINGLFKTYLFKSDCICGNMFVTSRRDGDRISPIGRNCTKSLKSLFNEAGMTQRQRDLTPVIRDEKGVVAVCGLAVDRRVAASVGDRVVRIQIEKE